MVVWVVKVSQYKSEELHPSALFPVIKYLCPVLLPWNLIDLPVVHGVEHGRIPDPFVDPQLDADAGVEEEHGDQRQQEQSHHDEGRVRLTVFERWPTLLAAHVVMIVQEVVLHLKRVWIFSGGTSESSLYGALHVIIAYKMQQ